jgi:hypothetical protein
MKSLLQATFAAITIATLAGCAAPLPKGSDTSKYLPTPVDVSKMKPVEMTLKAKNGDEYDALRFHDVAANKWFDSDGYPVNEKFLRVLKTGEVCEANKTTWVDKKPQSFNIESVDPVYCWDSKDIEESKKMQMGVIVGSLAVAGAVVAPFVAAGAAVDGAKAALREDE